MDDHNRIGFVAKALILVAVAMVLTVSFRVVYVPLDETSGQFGAESVVAHGTLPGLGPDTIPNIVANSSPSVVRIDTTEQSTGGYYMDPFFRQFFGLDMAPSQPRISHGMGSGFIVSSDGYILTCEHVVGSADTIEVTLTGHDTPYSAKKIGTDKELDLAVLKIDPAGVELPALNLGDFDQVRVGDWVIAIGNPYGLDHTVTVGVISAKGRPVTIQSRQYKDLLQTDASINPGNSGGPLLNLNGEVVGINNAINAQAQGIGFAIPSSTVEEALRDMIEKGGIDRPWLGVTSQAVNRQTANYYGLQDTSGALVVQVTPASPAEKAGLKRGDLITHYNGSKINKPEELTALVGSSGIGAKAEIRFNRGNESITLTVTIEANNN